MRIVTTSLLTAALVATGVALASAQGGPRGSGYGFGMRSWALHENGVDSIAARVELTDEQRGQLEGLARGFQDENAEAVDRMNRMHAEIDTLWTDMQRPRWEAMDSIARKYDYPERDLRPALTKLHNDMAGIITVQQQRQLQDRRPLAGRSRWAGAGRGYMGSGRGPTSMRRGQAGFSQRGGRRLVGRNRMGQMQRMRLHRPPPIQP